jgi:hypothetical protein
MTLSMQVTIIAGGAANSRSVHRISEGNAVPIPGGTRASIVAASRANSRANWVGLAVWTFCWFTGWLSACKKGLAHDLDAYDAPAWSAPGPLSEASVKQGGAPGKFPDFTRGRWKETRGWLVNGRNGYSAAPVTLAARTATLRIVSTFAVAFRAFKTGRHSPVNQTNKNLSDCASPHSGQNLFVICLDKHMLC